MTNATVSNTLPGPEPGGPRPTGAPARRATLAGAPARPAARTSSGGPRQAGHRDEGFAASLDASLDRSREARTDDDPRDAARAGTDRSARADESPTRRAAAQPWWLRAQAERSGMPDADADADQVEVTSGGSAASAAGSPVAASVDEHTGSDAVDAGAGEQAAAQAAAQMAAMMAAQGTAAPAPVITAGATAPQGDAADGGELAGVTAGGDGGHTLAEVAGVIGPQDTELTDGMSAAPRAMTAVSGDLADAQTSTVQSPPQAHPETQAETGLAAGADIPDGASNTGTATELREPSIARPASHATRPGGKHGWAFQALKQAAAAVNGGGAGVSAAAGAMSGAAQAGVGAEIRAAARAGVSAAADGPGSGTPAMAGGDPVRESTAGGAQAVTVEPSLLTASAGSGGQTADSDARDARPGTSEQVIELGARAAGAGGGSAPVFVAPMPATTPEAAMAFAVPVADAAPAGDIPEAADNLGRLVQSFRMQTRDGLSEATVRLNPNHLGEVTIAIRVDKGIVSATVQAETGSVRQWLQGQEETLRATLAEQGLTLEHYAVEPDGQRRQQSPDDEPQAQARRRNRMRPSDGRTFEVLA